MPYNCLNFGGWNFIDFLLLVFLQALEGIDIKKYWSPKLYIENTLGDPKENIRHRVNFNDKGEAFIVEKRVIKGTFMENLELNDFPFDVQVSFFFCCFDF